MLKLSLAAAFFAGWVVLGAIAETGYSISLYHSGVPATNCDMQYNHVLDTLYQTYVQEMVVTTNITFDVVSDFDPDWYHRRLQSQNVRRREATSLSTNHSPRRRLGPCYQLICSKPLYVIVVNGCQRYCGLRNLEESRSLISTSPDPTRPYGNKTSRIADTRGDVTVSKLYNNIDIYVNVTDPCHAILSEMLYQIDDLEIS